MNIYNSTRTIYNVKLQTCMMASIPYTPLPNTTLNEKFNILQFSQQSCLEQSTFKYPTIQGIVIGNGGKDIVTSDIGNLRLGKHSPVDGALFNHLPFVLREENNDIPDTDKLKYRLRKELYINDKKYIAYYLKKFSEDDLQYRPEILYVDNSNVIPSIKIFNTDRVDILEPEPDLDNRMSTYENTVYTVNMLRFKFNLDDVELLELKNVFNILGIKDTLITEVGVVTGVDIDLDKYKELVYAQIAYFLDVSLNLEIIDEGLEKTLEIGGGEIIPLRKNLINDG